MQDLTIPAEAASFIVLVDGCIYETNLTFGEARRQASMVNGDIAVRQSRKIRPPRPLMGAQTFMPEPDERAGFTPEENAYLSTPTTRREVREVMKNRHGVCG